MTPKPHHFEDYEYKFICFKSKKKYEQIQSCYVSYVTLMVMILPWRHVAYKILAAGGKTDAWNMVLKVQSKKIQVKPHVKDNTLDTSNSEHFKVNWAKTDSYRMSAIPYIKKMLNEYVKKKAEWWMNIAHYILYQ